jgi:hypothetical protein
VAAAEASDPHHLVRALSLTAVLALARTLSLAGRDLDWSLWTIPAYYWHDAAVGAAFWAVDRLLRPRRWGWAPYALIVAWAAINVPVTRALSSPLTMPMLRAAGGALLDSIRHYVTTTNVLAIAAVLTAGAIVPRVLRRLRPAARAGMAMTALALLITGPIAATRVSTVGLHRNAVTALIISARPRIAARPASDDWRRSPFDVRIGDDLSELRGIARDFNVVVIALESAGASYLGLHGAAPDPMPQFTSLARDGLVFEHAYAVYPESIRGLFATMCSRSPSLDTPAETLARAECASLPRLLGAAGYRTGVFHSGRFAYLGMDDIVRAQGFDTAEDAGHIGGVIESSFGVDEPSAVAHMLAWIDALPRGQRFMLTYLPVAGHHPYASPDRGPFTVSTEIDTYRNALYYGDRSLGELVGGLRARGLADRTLFVVFGDHGEAFDQHPGNIGHSQFIYEENIRVPLAIVPGNVRVPRRIGRPATVVDIAPTILDLTGQPIPASYEGVSLLEPAERMALFFTDYTVGWLGLRDGCWKYLYELDAKRSQLFDVCGDPGERHDVSPNQAERVTAYRDRLERWAAAQKAAIVRR